MTLYELSLEKTMMPFRKFMPTKSRMMPAMTMSAIRTSFVKNLFIFLGFIVDG